MLVGEVFARMGLDSKQYEKGLGKLEGMTQKKAVTLGSIFKGAFSFALGMGLISGFRSLGGAITDFVNTAARTEVLGVAMQSVARSSGYALGALEQQRKAVMDLGIAEQEATQILTRFMQAQLDTADAAKLARVAQDAAVIAGYNSSQAAEQMTEAIAKQRPELLSAFGMTRNMNEIYKDYAGTVGKTAAQLSEAEKKQAMLNYILAEGEKIAGTYEASMGAVGKQIGSLPRYWDTLKNAIAKPLALPAISVIVDALTNGLKNAISWAEANTMTLQRWGQTAANVAGYVVKGFQFVTRTFAENWGMIRFTATALITYATATKVAAGATALFQAVSLALNGQLVAKIPLLGFVSTAMGIYKVQMALASAQGIVLSGVLAKVRVALYSVWSALGPIGWAILVISAALGIGVSLWSKYNQAVQAAAQKAQTDKMAQQQQDYVDSVNEAAKGTESQADALDELGKASQKNLQSFDEVHNLMEETASAGLSVPTLDEGIVPPIPEMELPGLEDFAFDMDAAIADAKSQMGGFWGWLGTLASETWDNIKQWGTNLWEGVKGGWDGFANYCSSLWENLKSGAANSWAKIKSDAATMWEGVKGAWGAFSQWAGGLWDGVKDKWGGFKEWASQTWDNMSSKASNTWASIKTGAATGWENIRKTVVTKWDAFKTGAASTWDQVKTGAGIAWQNIKTGAAAGWNGIKTAISTKWDSLKSGASTTWSNIKLTISGKWNDLKAEAPTSWENIKTSISTRWNDLKSQAPTVWENVKNSIATRWNALKAEAPTTWESIKTGIATRWDSLKNSAPGTWDNIKTAISSRFDEAKANVLTAAQTMYDKVPKTWDEMRAAIGALNNKVLSAITSPFEDAKKIVLGIVESAKNWGKNMMSNVVDGIKSKVSAVTQAARNVANTIKGFLGFGSPTEEGPGRDADKWAPNLMQMYSGGITAGIPKVRSSVNAAASELTGLTAMPSVPSIPTATAGIAGSADAIAQAVYRAMMDAARITSASTDNQPQGTQEIVLRIDSSTFARLMLPSIIKEGQRQGLNLVVRPQGV